MATKPSIRTPLLTVLERCGSYLWGLAVATALLTGAQVLHWRDWNLPLSLQAADWQPLFSHPWRTLAISHTLLGLALLAVLAWSCRKRQIYLIDFHTFRPPDRLAGSRADLVRGYDMLENLTDQTKDFARRVAEMSGLGDQTYGSEELIAGHSKPLRTTYDGARAETELALTASIQQLLDATRMHPHEIDALIVNNCSWSPVPSLASFVVNKFKFKSTCLTYNFSGLGCTATVIAIGFAEDLLQNHLNMRVLIASTENVTSSVYLGNSRSMMITNLIFRLGGVAFLMSNHGADSSSAKYQLGRVVRTHMGASDDAYQLQAIGDVIQRYRCVLERADDDGKVGVKIGKELMNVAGRALKMHIKTLAPLVLPLSEKLVYIVNYIKRKVLRHDIKEYSPDFTRAFEHFCIHTGGKVVIDAVSSALKLKPEQGDPCRATFHRFGNLSAASTWYNWSFIETKQGVRRGDRVWQLSFGSGFKVCSATWHALRDINSQHHAWTEKPSCA